MRNIYEIQQELLSIFYELEENGGEITPELEEKLNITQETFRDKIRDYSNVVRQLQNDIINIKAEKDRLNNLQKSKEKTIERLKSVMTEAIEQFGDTSKAGSKFLDYGTGKVYVRHNEAVEVNEEATNRFINRYFSGLAWWNMQNQLHNNICSSQDLLDYVNSRTDEEIADNADIVRFNVSDMSKLTACVSLDLDMKELLGSNEGYELARALINFNKFEVKAKVNKTDIKREAKEEHSIPCFAKLVESKSVTIK